MRRKRENGPSAPMNTAMKYLTYSARTVREMERHLDSCQYGEVEVYETVERLKELNLLNDRQYAADFIRSRLSSKPVSRAHLREQMRQHEIPEGILEESLLAVDDATEEENAFQIISKYMRQLSGLPEEERKQKAVQRALARGFEYGTVKKATGRYADEQERSSDD